MIQGWYFHMEFSWLDLAGIFIVIIFNYIHFRGVDPVPKKTEGRSRVRERVSNHGTAGAFWTGPLQMLQLWRFRLDAKKLIAMTSLWLTQDVNQFYDVLGFFGFLGFFG
jgi:hypothetical protein